MSRIDMVIAELLECIRAEGEKPPEFKEGMLAIGPEGGRFVETVVRAVKPKRGLEIGTSSGFSALCAFKGDLSGEFRLITVDFDPAKAHWARENFDRAGVGDRVEILVMDGLDAARQVQGLFDYVLLDAAKSQNLPILKELVPKLTAGAVILTDNALTHRAELEDFTRYVRNHYDLASSLVETGNGIEVTFRLASPIAP